MKLPKDTPKDLRLSLEERSHPKADTRTDITTSNIPEIKTIDDGQMVINTGTGYVRSRNKLNRMLMVDVDNVTSIDTSTGTTDIDNKLNEIINALKSIGAIK